MGRRAGPPTTRKEILFEDSLLQYLDALIATAPVKLTFTALVHKAAQDYVDSEMAKPEVREKVEAHLKRHRVVKLSEVRKAREKE